MMKTFFTKFLFLSLFITVLLGGFLAHASAAATAPAPVSCQGHPEAARLALAGPDHQELCFTGEGVVYLPTLIPDVIGACSGSQPTWFDYDSTSDPAVQQVNPLGIGEIALFVPARQCRFVSQVFLAAQLTSMSVTSLLIGPAPGGSSSPSSPPTSIHQAGCHSTLFTLWQNNRCQQGFDGVGTLTLSSAISVDRVCTGDTYGGSLALVPPPPNSLSSISVTAWQWRTCAFLALVLPLVPLPLSINQITVTPDPQE